MQLAEFYLTGTGVEWNPEMAVFYLSQCPNQEDNIRTSFSLVERSRLSELLEYQTAFVSNNCTGTKQSLCGVFVLGSARTQFGDRPAYSATGNVAAHSWPAESSRN
eukprot:m.263734 g.263734  ORF g.263734 m.263734 type:complete len:106 (-) comp16012_c0_seq10:315-632(-)